MVYLCHTIPSTMRSGSGIIPAQMKGIDATTGLATLTGREPSKEEETQCKLKVAQEDLRLTWVALLLATWELKVAQEDLRHLTWEAHRLATWGDVEAHHHHLAIMVAHSPITGKGSHLETTSRRQMDQTQACLIQLPPAQTEVTRTAMAQMEVVETLTRLRICQEEICRHQLLIINRHAVVGIIVFICSKMLEVYKMIYGLRVFVCLTLILIW